MRRRALTMGLVAVCCLAACAPGGAETPTPSPEPSTTTPVPSVSPSPTPSPTSERDVAVAAAQEAFVAYWRATDELAAQGGAEKLPQTLVNLTTGPERRQSLSQAQGWRRDRFVSRGYGQLSAFSVVDDTQTFSTAPRVVLAACVDQTSLTTTLAGKPYTKRPNYVRVTEADVRSVNGRWKVYIWSGEIVPKGFTCENYS